MLSIKKPQVAVDLFDRQLTCSAKKLFISYTARWVFASIGCVWSSCISVEWAHSSLLTNVAVLGTPSGISIVRRFCGSVLVTVVVVSGVVPDR